MWVDLWKNSEMSEPEPVLKLLQLKFSQSLSLKIWSEELLHLWRFLGFQDPKLHQRVNLIPAPFQGQKSFTCIHGFVESSSSRSPTGMSIFLAAYLLWDVSIEGWGIKASLLWSLSNYFWVIGFRKANYLGAEAPTLFVKFKYVVNMYFQGQVGGYRAWKPTFTQVAMKGTP